MTTSKLSIYGSCVSRDVLEVGTRQFELAGYFARSSWISQNASPIACPPEFADSLSPFAYRVVCQDFEKSILDEIRDASPRTVVFDLIDERFGLVEMDNSWVTMSAYLQQTPLGRSIFDRGQFLQPWQTPRDELFDRATTDLARRLRDALPLTRWVVHRALFATEVAPNDAGTTFSASALANAQRINPILERWYETLAEKLDAVVVQAPPGLTVANPSHRWGFDHFHYIDDYYHWILDRFNALANE